MRKPYFPGHSVDFSSWQRLGVGGKDSYLISLVTARSCVLLLIISVNKMVKILAKGVKGYLRLRRVC